MTSQTVDIYSMLNKAQTEYNQQQNSVAAFFMQASNGGVNNKNHPSRSMPLPINSVNSLEQIERQIRTSPPQNRKSSTSDWLQMSAKSCFTFYWFAPDSYHINNNNQHHNVLQAHPQHQQQANSPLAQFFNSNNMNNGQQQRQAAPVEAKPVREKMNGQKISAPPGFNTKVQPQKNGLLMNGGGKETKLITPTMFAPSNNNNEKKPTIAEPLTRNQLLQALNYLIENDDEFMKKVHEAYIKSFKGLSS